jgi:hypothetical protein
MAPILRQPAFVRTLLGIATVLGTRLVASEPSVRDESRRAFLVDARGPAGRPAIVLAQKASAKKKAGVGKAASSDGAGIAGVDNAAGEDTGVQLSPNKPRAGAPKNMPSADIDLMIIGAAYERWNQASPNNKPEVTLGTRFIMLSTLPKDRAVAAMVGMDKAYLLLRTTLARPSASALDWRMKPSLFVFRDRNTLVEFVRTQENRALEDGESGTANFGVREPYAAVIDPLGGREEPKASVPARGKPRTRRPADEPPANDRSVAGLLAEQLAIGVVRKLRDPPRWLYLGLGASIAAEMDPRTSYMQTLRTSAAAQFQQNWTLRAQGALDGALNTGDTRVIGYALVDWMTHDPHTRAAFPAFVHALSEEGGTQLDEVLRTVFSARREDFLHSSAEWVSHYGPAR